MTSNPGEHVALPVGTRIRFNRYLREPACGDHPAFEFARPDELGRIIAHHPTGCTHAYVAETDSEPGKGFGCSQNEFEVIQ